LSGRGLRLRVFLGLDRSLGINALEEPVHADLYVIRWVLSAIQDDLAEFLEWERERNLRDSIPGTVVRKKEA